MIRIIAALPQLTALNQRLASGWFSKVKKGKAQAQLQETSINIRKVSEAHDGFLLYENTEGGKLKLISLAFLFCFGSGYWTYSRMEDDEIKVNYMIIGSLLAVPFLIFQFRTAKTLKNMVLDRAGENVVLTRFRYGGFGEERTRTRVEVLKGIGKAFVFGGSVIKGGGSYGLEERNYWFQSKYILEREVFEETVQGHRVRVDRTKSYE